MFKWLRGLTKDRPVIGSQVATESETVQACTDTRARDHVDNNTRAIDELKAAYSSEKDEDQLAHATKAWELLRDSDQPDAPAFGVAVAMLLPHLLSLVGYTEAEKLLTRALACVEGSEHATPALSEKLGEVMMRLERAAEAEAPLALALAHYRVDPDASPDRIASLWRRYGQAVNAHRGAVAAVPTLEELVAWIEAHTVYAPIEAQARETLALALAEAGRHDDAIGMVEAAVRLYSSEDPPLEVMIARCHSHVFAQIQRLAQGAGGESIALEEARRRIESIDEFEVKPVELIALAEVRHRIANHDAGNGDLASAEAILNNAAFKLKVRAGPVFELARYNEELFELAMARRNYGLAEASAIYAMEIADVYLGRAHSMYQRLEKKLVVVREAAVEGRTNVTSVVRGADLKVGLSFTWLLQNHGHKVVENCLPLVDVDWRARGLCFLAFSWLLHESTRAAETLGGMKALHRLAADNAPLHCLLGATSAIFRKEIDVACSMFQDLVGMFPDDPALGLAYLIALRNGNDELETARQTDEYKQRFAGNKDVEMFQTFNLV